MGLIVTGYSRHGKDTVCEELERFGFSWASSSLWACSRIVYPALASVYGYTSLDECFADRMNHRKEWHDLIAAYNKGNLTRLARDIFSSKDIYCGMRNINELAACRRAGLVDAVVWVDAYQRLGHKDTSDICSITKDDADFIIDNNCNEMRLRQKVRNIARLLLKP